MNKLTDIIARETFGKKFGAGKFCLDDSESHYAQEISPSFYGHSAESSHTEKYIDILPLSRNLSSGESILTYFLDGSRRVFKVGEISYNHKIYPITAGQISAGACRRVSRKLIPEISRREIVIAVPDIADPDGNKPGFFPSIARKLSQTPEMTQRGLEISAVITYSTAKDSESYDDKATAAIQDRMIQNEKEITESLVKKLNYRNYLIKDGSLEYRKKSQLPPTNYRWVVGLSKTFSPESCANRYGKIDPEYIAELPAHHRTHAIIYRKPEIFGDTEFAVWYIRLRKGANSPSAFSGIIKAEKILMTQSERNNHRIDSTEIDTLSAYILNERSPACYGNDSRWMSHIYPVYLTEKYIKSKYISAESFLHLF